MESRPWDRFGLGYFYLGLSNDDVVNRLPVEDEQGFEMFYSYAVTRSLHIAADVQYVNTGLSFRDDAWIAGLRTFIRF